MTMNWKHLQTKENISLFQRRFIYNLKKNKTLYLNTFCDPNIRFAKKYFLVVSFMVILENNRNNCLALNVHFIIIFLFGHENLENSVKHTNDKA